MYVLNFKLFNDILGPINMNAIMNKLLLLGAILLMSTASAAVEITSDDSIAIQTYLNALNESKNVSINAGKARAVVLTTLPTTVSEPSFTATFTRFSDSATLTFFRASASGATRLFVKVVPITPSIFFCPGGSQFTVIQNGRDYGQAFRVTYGDGGTYCSDLIVPAIFLVDQWSLYTNFDVLGSFALTWASTQSYYSGSLTVPAFSGTTSTPTPTVTSRLNSDSRFHAM